MNATMTRPSERVSRFVREALLSPDQVDDVILTPADSARAVKSADRPIHAHGDFGHADR